MKTKEEILEISLFKYGLNSTFRLSKPAILDAMEEYKKQFDQTEHPQYAHDGKEDGEKSANNVSDKPVMTNEQFEHFSKIKLTDDIKELFGKITCNDNREMTEERFIYAVTELLTSYKDDVIEFITPAILNEDGEKSANDYLHKSLIDFVKWIKKNYQTNEVYEMYVDEYLQEN